MKKILIAIVAVIVLGSTQHLKITQANDTLQLSDIQGHWAEKHISDAVRKKYVSGYIDGTFKPDYSISKAQFITMVVKALDLKFETSNPWYEGFVDAATLAGIYTGDFQNNEWNLELTRIEMAKLAVKVAGIKDYPNTKMNYDAYMYQAISAGLIHGVGNGNVAPQGKTTRAEAIAVIERILKIKSGETLNPADVVTRENAEFAWHRSNIYTAMEKHLDLYQSNMGLSGDADIFKLATSDGQYKGELLKLIVVDMYDKEAVKRHNVDLENWLWNAMDKAFFNISKYPDSFLVIAETKSSGEDNKKYNARGYVPYMIGGLKRYDFQEVREGVLKGYQEVVDKRNILPDKGYPTKFIPVSIIDKGSLDLNLDLTIYSPTVAGMGGQQVDSRLFDLRINK